MATDTGETELSKIYNFFGPENDFLEEGGEWRAALTIIVSFDTHQWSLSPHHLIRFGIVQCPVHIRAICNSFIGKMLSTPHSSLVLDWSMPHFHLEH